MRWSYFKAINSVQGESSTNTMLGTFFFSLTISLSF